jgi:hypothetical protein
MLNRVRHAIATETAQNGGMQHVERDGASLYAATIAPEPSALLQPPVARSSAATLGSASANDGHPNGLLPVA